ncbi:hypothetical protein [Sphingomonas sp. OTU376]|uniref:hypothetical protein n=1 Tax=Sphingomonas sp. OTU376 TaxID=3043863 RepID=UPI00313CB539
MTRHPPILAFAASLLLVQGAAVAQDVPQPPAPAGPPAEDPVCTKLRAEVAQAERDMQAESIGMTRMAEDMRKKMQARSKAARTGGLLSSLAGLIPGVGTAVSMGGSLMSSAATAGMGSNGMPKEMDQAMDRQFALSERMLTASQALHNRCGDSGSGPDAPMSLEELKALRAETAKVAAENPD